MKSRRSSSVTRVARGADIEKESRAAGNRGYALSWKIDIPVQPDRGRGVMPLVFPHQAPLSG
jgi:hypothetical protein